MLVKIVGFLRINKSYSLVHRPFSSSCIWLQPYEIAEKHPSGGEEEVGVGEGRTKRGKKFIT